MGERDQSLYAGVRIQFRWLRQGSTPESRSHATEFYDRLGSGADEDRHGIGGSSKQPINGTDCTEHGRLPG
ncbi:hypothetical protein [Halocatena pleomorpha]|uniref:Uncharacterized protein n=1 Tax=Halocatena pleomorpha TaxID=1785090 RepID=A0A3P3RD65_9EURY|nr:hypothetical protein [Halocatena pleomorpha]RRJ31447.1 hypothetical protein EIK79_06950 [Halocatena pleomorpha]